MTTDAVKDLARYVAQLSKSQKGLSAMRRILACLDDGGLSLDHQNKDAILALIVPSWRFPGSTRDAMREAVEKRRCEMTPQTREHKSEESIGQSVVNHLYELAEAWRTGALRSSDGLSKDAERSNRNWDLLYRLRTGFSVVPTADERIEELERIATAAQEALDTPPRAQEILEAALNNVSTDETPDNSKLIAEMQLERLATAADTAFGVLCLMTGELRDHGMTRLAACGSEACEQLRAAFGDVLIPETPSALRTEYFSELIAKMQEKQGQLEAENEKLGEALLQLNDPDEGLAASVREFSAEWTTFQYDHAEPCNCGICCALDKMERLAELAKAAAPASAAAETGEWRSERMKWHWCDGKPRPYSSVACSSHRYSATDPDTSFEPLAELHQLRTENERLSTIAKLLVDWQSSGYGDFNSWFERHGITTDFVQPMDYINSLASAAIARVEGTTPASNTSDT